MKTPLTFLAPLFLFACTQTLDSLDDGEGYGGAPGPDGSDGSVSPGAGGSSTSGGGSGPVTGSGGALPGSGGSASETPCGDDWVEGAFYAVGAIVRHPVNGQYYVATNENPGYDPTISTWFWDSYVCATDGGGNTGGSTSGSGGASSGFAAVVSLAQFDQMFPRRIPFYTYEDLVAATQKYPAFAATGDLDTRKREAAAFLANVARETGSLIYIDQIAKDVHCEWRADCPCENGKMYFGRGPIQITWNYNYCAAGAALGYNLRANPELVSQNDEIAWATGLWFWMTQTGAGRYVPHNAITTGAGFGETIRSINGAIECNGSGTEGSRARVDFYNQFCAILGVTPGANLGC